MSKEKQMSLRVALHFAEYPRPNAALCAPADTMDELREALTVLASEVRRLSSPQVALVSAKTANSHAQFLRRYLLRQGVEFARTPDEVGLFDAAVFLESIPDRAKADLKVRTGAVIAESRVFADEGRTDIFEDYDYCDTGRPGRVPCEHPADQVQTGPGPQVCMVCGTEFPPNDDAVVFTQTGPDNEPPSFPRCNCKVMVGMAAFHSQDCNVMQPVVFSRPAPKIESEVCMGCGVRDGHATGCLD